MKIDWISFSNPKIHNSGKRDIMEINNWKEILVPYEQAVDELKIKFKSIGYEYRKMDQYSPIEFVTGRVKKISSIIEKANKKGIPLENVQNEMDDIAGIRIMCQFVEDIDKVIELIRLRDGVDMTILEERDYINNTKDSGYRSYHILIKYPVITAMGKKEITAEIQIRTLAMNFWATIEHSLKYKYNQNMPQEVQERLVKAAEAAFLLDKEMSQIRGEILTAQELFQTKSNIVADILNNIQNLYYKADVEEMGSIQQKFMDLWQEGDLASLQQFNQQLDTMAELYRVQSIPK